MNSQKTLRILRYILAGITFVSLSLFLLRQIEEHDLFWHLATGRWIIENLSLPTHDPFNYTTPSLLSSREHFILTSYWLSQILYYGIYYVSGWNGFILSRFIILGIIIYFVYKRARGSDRTILFSVVAVTSIMFVQGYTFERPQIFSFLFFAILLYLLERQAKVKKKNLNLNLNLNLFLLPLLMLVWANMHGGFILGQVVILVYLIAEGLKFLHPSLRPMGRSSYQRFVIAGAAGILSALINPNTYKAIIETWGTMKHISSTNIMEHWSTITFFKAFYAYDIPIYWLLLLIAVLSMLYRIIRKRFDVLDIVMLAGLGYFSFTQVRYIAFFLIWAAPFISISLTTLTLTHPSPLLGKSPEATIKGEGKGGVRYICLFLSIFIITTFILKQKEFGNVKNITSFKTGQWIDDYYPEDAVSFIIQNDIKGNMFNYYDWGGYLIWRFYPGKKVFIDGRNLYRFQYSQWMSIINATLEPEVRGMPCYKALIESYRVRYMLIPVFTQGGEIPPIVGEMIRDKEWVPVFFSGNSMIFVKDTHENYDVIRAYFIPKDKFIDKLFKMIDDRIKESPEDFTLYLAKGDLYRSQRKVKEAREEYVKVLKINPFNDTAKERLELLNMNYPR